MRTCTICNHEHYADMIAELKVKIPRTSVAAKFNVDYTSLGRCWSEHRAHDQEYEVNAAIKRSQKALNTELKKKDQNRLLIKDLELRLRDLRSEQRQLQAIRKAENPDLTDGGEIPLTVEALDKLIANEMAHPADTDGDACIKRVERLLRFDVPKLKREEVCKSIEALIAQSLNDYHALKQRPMRVS